ncbi:HAD family hydrolase [Anaerostipes sp.]|uniref:HAD family hydrolase n=1 Tax=Anaerostipes sp. TaxID=1872530 RepID=UPI00258F1437|nr:HAD family hydrolase [Anaerostipes sp.]MCI5624252.1 HAD family hydrolase [Anaerostipes sp.]
MLEKKPIKHFIKRGNHDKETYFFDVDGTLVDPATGQIPDSTLTTLEELQKRDHLICIATGRPLFHPENPKFFSTISWDGYICCNGLAVYNNKKEPVSLHAMTSKSIEQCIQVTQQNNFNLLFEEEHNFYLLNDQLEYVEETQRFLNQTIPPLGTYNDQDIYGLMVYAPKGYDYKEYFSIDGIDVFPGQSAYADIVKVGANKYSGISELMDYYGYSSYIAFGDSNNDLEMLENADLSICLGQGSKEAKSVSKYITTPVDQDGIYLACKYFKLI